MIGWAHFDPSAVRLGRSLGALVKTRDLRDDAVKKSGIEVVVGDCIVDYGIAGIDGGAVVGI
jgi:hypothetical protein